MNPRNTDPNAQRTLDTPVGTLVLVASPGGLSDVRLATSSSEEPQADPKPEVLRHLEAAHQALVEYFEGDRKSFDDLSLAPEGTAFQLRVWRELLSIPYGETLSYGQLARRIGRPAASRAVGMANGRNPIPIIIPCHRVIGADGSLTGYGGGLPMKEWLLGHEGALSQPSLGLFRYGFARADRVTGRSARRG